MANTKKQSNPNWLIAAFLAWLLPGAGHFYIGRPVRGAILFITIGLMFWGGMAMGGAMTVDKPYEPWWYYAQMCTGIHGIVGWRQQDKIYKQLAEKGKIDQMEVSANGRPTAGQIEVDKALEKEGIVLAQPVAGVARAYTGIAGLLNLLCAFDAMMLAMMGCGAEPKRNRESQHESRKEPRDG